MLECVIYIKINIKVIAYNLVVCGISVSYFFRFFKQDVCKVAVPKYITVTFGRFTALPHRHNKWLSFRIVFWHKLTKTLIANNTQDRATAKILVLNQTFVVILILNFSIEHLAKL